MAQLWQGKRWQVAGPPGGPTHGTQPGFLLTGPPQAITQNKTAAQPPSLPPARELKIGKTQRPTKPYKLSSRKEVLHVYLIQVLLLLLFFLQINQTVNKEDVRMTMVMMLSKNKVCREAPPPHPAIQLESNSPFSTFSPRTLGTGEKPDRHLA